MILVFLGPPGSGKGTQAQMVGSRLRIPHISTGDILREAVALKTGLGLKARVRMDRGELVPDDIILSLVGERIAGGDCSGGCVLDGFPRTLAQATGFDEVVRKSGRAVDLVLLIDVHDDTVFKRLSQRRVCPECKALHNLEHDTGKSERVCDRCGVALVLRSDDAEDTVRTRLAVYRRETLPVIDYYEDEGILRRIDGDCEVAEVFDSIMREIQQVRQGEA